MTKAHSAREVVGGRTWKIGRESGSWSSSHRGRLTESPAGTKSRVLRIMEGGRASRTHLGNDV